MTRAPSSAPTRCATRRRAVGQAAANPAGVGKWMPSPRRRGGACAPRPYVCRRGFSLALLALTRHDGFAPRLAACFFVDAVDGAQCIARPFPAALKVDPIPVAVFVFARNVFGGDSLWFVCHIVCVGWMLGVATRVDEVFGPRERCCDFDCRAVLRRFAGGIHVVLTARDLVIAEVAVADLANHVIAVDADRRARLRLADDFCGVLGFHYSPNLTHLLILSTGFSKFFLGGFYRVKRAKGQKKFGLARLFDTRRGATRLKAGKSMRNVNNQPSDPSPWALMGLLSAAAGLRVFCVYL